MQKARGAGYQGPTPMPVAWPDSSTCRRDSSAYEACQDLGDTTPNTNSPGHSRYRVSLANESRSSRTGRFREDLCFWGYCDTICPQHTTLQFELSAYRADSGLVVATSDKCTVAVRIYEDALKIFICNGRQTGASCVRFDGFSADLANTFWFTEIVKFGRPTDTRMTVCLINDLPPRHWVILDFEDPEGCTQMVLSLLSKSMPYSADV